MRGQFLHDATTQSRFAGKVGPRKRLSNRKFECRSMDAFNDYEEQLKELCQSVRKQCEQVKTAKGEARRSAIATAKDEFDEAQEIFHSLTLASHGLGTQAAKAKVKTYEGELADLRKLVDRSKTLFERDDLVGGAIPSDLATTSLDHRNRVLQDTERLKRTTDVVRQAAATAEDTVSVGVASLSELQKQRETIESAREKVGAVNTHLGTGQRIMRGMARRVMTNKLITLLLALIMLGGIGLIVWLKWFDNPEPDMTTTLATNATMTATPATGTTMEMFDRPTTVSATKPPTVL
jgi:vesicle transport through interaction with t-SNAREs protein 1